MKKFVLATVAFSFIATPAAFAQRYDGPPRYPQERNYNPYKQKHVQKQQVRKHRWAKGQRFDRHSRHTVIRDRDYRRYHLSHPPRGHHWVRVDDEFILVATATGIISSILFAATH